MHLFLTALLVWFLGSPALSQAQPAIVRSDNRAVDLNSPIEFPQPPSRPLTNAIALEATRLALSPQTEEQPRTRPEPRHWCRRHLVACGTLIGFSAGFLVGLTMPPEDWDPSGFALIYGGPIGAGIGAATGGIIWAYTEPKP